MFNVTFYRYNKKARSTGTPASGGTTYACTLKAGSTITSPTIMLDVGISSAPDFNYARIDVWGRWYVITEWTFDERLWTASLQVDLLASYKTNIQALSAFVVYDATSNTELSDSRLSTKTTFTSSQASGSFGILGSTSLVGNVIIVTVTGRDSTATYALNAPQVKSLLNNMTNWLDLNIPEIHEQDIIDSYEALKALAVGSSKNARQLVATGTACDNIRSAFQLPFAMGNIPGTSTSTIFLGEYESDVTGKDITGNRILRDTATVSIPWQASDWRRNAPYHEIFLYNPFAGLIQLSNSDLIGVSSLTINATIDLLTGDTLFEVLAGSRCINQTTANLAASFPIGASNITPANVASNVLSAAGNAAGIAGNAMTMNIGGAVQSGIGMAQSIFNAMQPSSTCVNGGGGGAAMGLSGTVYCYTIFHDTSDAPEDTNAVMGSPTMAVKSLGSLSGYVQTSGAAIRGNMLDSERQQLNSLLDGGIFIE